MTSFESKITRIPAPIDKVYAKLSDLNNLEAIRDRIPADKLAQIKEMRFDADSCTINVDPVGALTFRIIEREAPKLVKFSAENSPLPLFMWVQFVPVDEQNTKTRITVKAEINAFLKPMVSKPLQEAIDRMAEMLAVIPYNN
ncbi:MAG: SRPBCC family protein [Bacteroidaceae bacterium]|nr:SRPBCC family protein [Bacteroidaceae bacterium]